MTSLQDHISSLKIDIMIFISERKCSIHNGHSHQKLNRQIFGDRGVRTIIPLLPMRQPLYVGINNLRMWLP